MTIVSRRSFSIPWSIPQIETQDG